MTFSGYPECSGQAPDPPLLKGKKMTKNSEGGGSCARECQWVLTTSITHWGAASTRKVILNPRNTQPIRTKAQNTKGLKEI